MNITTPLIPGLQATTLFVAFLLNALAAALVSTLIVEIRLSRNKNYGLSAQVRKALITLFMGLIVSFAVYNSMYVMFGFGSSMVSTRSKVPYW